MSNENGSPIFDFGALEVAHKTTRVDLPEQVGSGEAFVVVRPATDANAKYQAGVLRLSGKRRSLTSKPSPERDRNDDRELYPKHVIVAWGGIQDREGSDVEFTEENVAAFLKALPNWIFDRIRVAAMRPENFLDAHDDSDDPPNAATVAGN